MMTVHSFEKQFNVRHHIFKLKKEIRLNSSTIFYFLICQSKNHVQKDKEVLKSWRLTLFKLATVCAKTENTESVQLAYKAHF